MRSTTKEHRNKLAREWRRRNVEKVRLIDRRKYERGSYLRRKYGITKDEYLQMIAAQKNCCALCGGLLGTDRNEKPHVDHCHVTGRLRGILHGRCNHMLGFSRDNVQILTQAVEYLQRYS